MGCFSCFVGDDFYKSADKGPFMANHTTGQNAGYHAAQDAPKDTQVVKYQPPVVPAISVDELKEITDNFGTKALIGEGSYGRVYHGVLWSSVLTFLMMLMYHFDLFN